LLETDKAKFHRVIKNLRIYEGREMAKRKPEKVVKVVKVIEYEKGIGRNVVNSVWLSIFIPIMLAIILLLIEYLVL